MNTVFILEETINGENPKTASEIESTPKVEPKIVSDLPTAVTSFFLALVSSSSSAMRYN